MHKTKVAIIGSGNIGTDLMVKLLRQGRHVELAALVGVDPASDGLARAARLGVATTHDGLDGQRSLRWEKECGTAMLGLWRGAAERRQKTDRGDDAVGTRTRNGRESPAGSRRVLWGLNPRQ